MTAEYIQNVLGALAIVLLARDKTVPLREKAVMMGIICGAVVFTLMGMR